MADNHENDRTYIYVGTIGAKGHGKTTLTAAITHVLAKEHLSAPQSFASVDDAPEYTTNAGVTYRSSMVDYASKSYVYFHSDCPDYMDYVKGLITGHLRIGTAILVVSIDVGFNRETDGYLRLLRSMGISNVIVYINKADTIHDEAFISEMASLITEQLEEAGYDRALSPVIVGSAKKALEGDPKWENSIKALVQAMEDYVVPPNSLKDRPFYMPIEDAFMRHPRGSIAYSIMEAGTIRVNDLVELIGIKDARQTNCSSIEVWSVPQESVSASERVAIGLAEIPRDEIETGMVLCEKGTLKSCQRFEALLYCLTGDEGGRKTPLHNGFEGDFRLHYLDVAGTASWPRDIEMMVPGDELNVTVRLSKSMAMKAGVEFEVRQNGQIVAVGRITCPID
ncbi:GTP-binding protein [Pseudoalteromonas sp. DL2-H2.2]|uniref:GTP-binding protein n=1 Tax=Pseudoalteromonas sp. DL2-H2.2 TaxID=2908889 RepID=UPI001F3D78A9|nr:GTP-binding protein [Pseudoalteromonas sp. DL2-H2.2]MCF2910810.1 GTP-binding protein [Pseudoalteromonas sp. DL2-H2.2]